MAQWKDALAMITGTWVRFPGPPNACFNFFLTCSHAAFQKKSTIHLKQSACQVASKADPKAWIGRAPYSWSTHAPGKFQKSEGLCA